MYTKAHKLQTIYLTLLILILGVSSYFFNKQISADSIGRLDPTDSICQHALVIEEQNGYYSPPPGCEEESGETPVHTSIQIGDDRDRVLPGERSCGRVTEGECTPPERNSDPATDPETALAPDPNPEPDPEHCIDVVGADCSGGNGSENTGEEDCIAVIGADCSSDNSNGGSQDASSGSQSASNSGTQASTSTNTTTANDTTSGDDDALASLERSQTTNSQAADNPNILVQAAQAVGSAFQWVGDVVGGVIYQTLAGIGIW